MARTQLMKWAASLLFIACWSINIPGREVSYKRAYYWEAYLSYMQQMRAILVSILLWNPSLFIFCINTLQGTTNPAKSRVNSGNETHPHLWHSGWEVRIVCPWHPARTSTLLHSLESWFRGDTLYKQQSIVTMTKYFGAKLYPCVLGPLCSSAKMRT